MATSSSSSVRRAATPDPEDYLLSDSEPEDLQDLEEQTDAEQGNSSRTTTSTPNASLLSQDCTVSTPNQSLGSISGDEASFMVLLRETNAIVKRFDARMEALELKVEELGQKEESTAIASRTQGKGKAAVSDEIRVRHSLSSQASTFSD